MPGYVETVAVHQDTWGTFLEPVAGLGAINNLHEVLHIPIKSGHRADLKSFAGRSMIFDKIAAQIAAVSMPYEDQCSAQHYFDVFSCVERDHEELSRIIDVGVYMGGTSSMFAGCLEPLALELDLVDYDHFNLQFTYETASHVPAHYLKGTHVPRRSTDLCAPRSP